MKTKYKILYIIMIVFFINMSYSFVQTNIKEAIEKIENGFIKNNVSLFSNIGYDSGLISPDTKISLNLSNGTNGNFSNKQAFYIFQNYFKEYKVSKCVIDKKTEGDGQLSITGKITFIHKGQEINSSIYLNIKKEINSWKILHITIN